MQKLNLKLQTHQNRRGIAILWLILWGAMFLTFFCVVLEISSMWQAQVELKNTMDAAALAAVRDWGLSGAGSTQVARDVGVAYVGANPVQGSAVSVTTNYNPGNTNQNATTNGNFVFGSLVTTNPPTAPIYFDPAGEGGCGLGDVTITIHKEDDGVSVDSDAILVEFNTTVPPTNPNLEIQSIEFYLPDPPKNKNGAYFNGVASVDTTAGSYGGANLDPTATNFPTTPYEWTCPNSGVGTICFEFLPPTPVDGNPGTEFQRARINFEDDTMHTGYFFHFGMDFGNFGGSGYPSPPHNDGDSWGNFGVTATITFRIPGTPDIIETVTSTFINTGGDDGISQAFFTGGAGGGAPAVVTRATADAQGFCSQMLGVALFKVSATSVAYYDCSTKRTYLVNIDNFPSLTLPPP